MTNSDHNESSREPQKHLPAERSPDHLDELAPHQKTVEQFATLYFEGCRRVAGVITSLKERWRDD